jgi:protoheme IX farnesyltransferase
LAYLALFSTVTVAAVAALNWIVYVGLYTPLKPVTMWHLPVGAIAGAIPILIGAAITGATFSPMAILLFAILFCWQFPHTVAIGWLYGDQYKLAGLRVITVDDPTGRRSGRIAIAGALSLCFLGIVPATLHLVSWTFAAIATGCAIVYLRSALSFAFRPAHATARQLLRASLIYLPTLLLLIYLPTLLLVLLVTSS